MPAWDESNRCTATTWRRGTPPAQRRRVIRNPREREEGADTEVIPVQAARVGTSSDNSAARLHLTTADEVPIAVELKLELLRELIEQLQQAADALGPRNPGRFLH